MMNYQSLPYNAQQPQFNPVMFTLDQPPFIPHGIQIPQNMSYLLNAVCSAVANEATNQRNKHAARMFTFNQIASNSFQNSDFATAVASVFDILMLGLAKQLYNVPEQGLPDAVTRALSIMACRNLSMYPALAQIVDPRVTQEAVQVLNEAQFMQQEISAMKARMGGGFVAPGGYQAPQQNFGGVPPGFAGSPMQGQGSVPFSRFNDIGNQQQPQTWNTGGNSSSPFVRGGHQGQNPAPAMVDTGDRYSYLNKNQQAFQQPVQQPVQQQFPSPPEPMLVRSTPIAQQPEVKKELKWVSSHHQYHQPAYNSETEKLELYEFQQNGKTYVIAKVVTKGVNEVDRNKHVITTPMMTLTSHIPQGSSTREAAFEKSVEKMTHNESPVLNAKPTVSSKTLIRNFTEELIFDTRVAQKLVSPENDCGVFQMNSIKATPFVATKDITEVASKLSEMKNFQDIALTMQSILNSDTDQEVKDFVFELDLFLTKEVNNVLQNRMSIDLSVDSFVDDISDMSEYLKEKKGESFSIAFDKNQEEFIETYLTPIDDKELVDQMHESLMDSEDDHPVDLSSVFYWHSYTITNVRMHSSELKIGIGPKTSSIITDQSFPVLRNFCKKLFNSVSKEDHGYAHHVLITSDNKKYELHRSMFVPDTYLISYFK